MPKETWIIASVLTAVLLLGLLGLASWEKKREVEKVRAELAEALAAAAKTQAEAADLKDKLAESQSRIHELAKE
jgi:predicted  nucleic acid-binding Zn-ribbon protein